MIGQTIRQYRITAKLGEGGMGEVYLAEDTNLKRQVALKFLPRHFNADDEARSRFNREAQALAALNHPNIVAVYDVTEHEDQPFIAMEYVEGQSLKDLVESGDLAVEKAVNIVAQAADGLAAAHKREIVHRDIKSENIVFSSEGRVKIMDFGLATWQGVTKVTAEGSTLGTRAYMSPQQSMGGEVDHRTDLWSLGVVLYELVTRQLPFAGGHDSAIAYSIANEEPEPIARYKSGSPDELQRIVSKCLAKNPDERYQSAADLAIDLRGLRSGASGAYAQPTTVPSRIRKSLASLGAVVIVALIAAIVALVWNPFHSATEEPEARRKMLAVLPFENLGSDDQEYFADGITDEIMTRLAGVQGLSVISRSSSIQYKGSHKSTQEIAKELGVDYILEGTIRWDQSGSVNQVRISPQLVNVTDDTQLWAESYDRPLKQVFSLQSEIAEEVSTALNVTLLTGERNVLGKSPTNNLEAYDLYLRAREYMNRNYKLDDFANAEGLLKEAIAKDSSFALAYALLSDAYASQFWFGSRKSERWRMDSAKTAADHALTLDQDLPQAHVSLGTYYYWGLYDYDRALSEYEIARREAPNEVIGYIGAIYRRQGKWAKALDSYERATELNPRSAVDALEYAITLMTTRHYAIAEKWYDRAVELQPDLKFAPIFRADNRRLWTGDMDQHLQLLDEAAKTLPFNQVAMEYARHYVLERDYGKAREYVTVDAALNSSWGGDSVEYYQAAALIYFYENKQELALAYADTAIAHAMRTITEDSTFAGAFVSLGQMLALQGHKVEAIKAGLRATQLHPMSTDQFDGTTYLESLANIYALVGEEEKAIDILDQVLSIPSWYSVNDLRLDPIWDSLRDNPRFQALIDRGDVVF